jgi:DNA-binding XRE family transcriptional regulator
MRNPKAVERVRLVLGRNIRQKRNALGLTQADAAERAGIYWRHWQKIEAGQVNATIATLVSVAVALETTIPALFTERKAGS